MKEKLFTRSMKTYDCVVKVYDNEADTMKDVVCTIPYVKTDKDVMNFVKITLESKAIKVIMVKEKVLKEKLYAITESDFLSMAKELPPRKKGESADEE